jgi:hypothetical protein
MDFDFDTFMKLKAAGFPMPIRKQLSLTELIEALKLSGEFCLMRHSDGWEAGYWDIFGNKFEKSEYGSTPDIAVANLWLALQGKKDE